MKDKNGIEINRDQKVSVIGEFEGVAVNNNGEPTSPYTTKNKTFDGSEIITVRGTRDGETCLFNYEGYSYEANPLDNPTIVVLPPRP